MKILVAIANYGTKNMRFLHALLKEYRSMSYETDIVVFSNIPKELGEAVEVKVGLPSKNPWSLPFAHKKVFAERVNEYDLFIYSEDDTLITEHHIAAFLDVTRILPKNVIAGFLRYEFDRSGNKYYSSVHSHFHWIPDSLVSVGRYAFARFTNDHSACYLLTREQLKIAIDSGGYLVEPHEGRYDLLVTAATDPYTQCGLSKIICVSHLNDFELHHLPDVYIGRLGVAERELNQQISALLKNSVDTQRHLFAVETKCKQERWSKSFYEPAREDIVGLIPNYPQNILSVGCGWGAMEAALVQRGHKVAAVPLDSVIGSCAEAKGVEITCPDFYQAFRSLSGRRFDCIIFSEVLQHIPDPVKVLSNYVSLLSNDGMVVISVPNFSSIKLRHAFTSEGILSKEMSVFDRTGLHMTTPDLVKTWLKQSNLRVVHSLYGAQGRSRLLMPIMPGRLKGLVAEEYLIVARKVSYEF
ncbi:class I SAM-dependent methyltransferase [Nitrospira sp. BLG_1]|uniref:class I SAM-dependent methyltransferase n=1 Tax=Nitrospira sp. BLG_1 TaxID=3395883 RepID=UPI0039BD87FF